MSELDDLRRAIAALEAQRAELGDGVVDAAVAPLRLRIAELKSEAAASRQRRAHATVLLADISGFTSLASNMDPEEVSDTMNALWDRVDRVVIEHGGTIDKHIGDAVMALWGVERSDEDDPERAVRAALGILEATRAFSRRQGLELCMRVGVNTGPVVFGGVGTTGELTAMGDVVNVMRRVEQAAAPDTVLVSHDTYRHVRGVFDFAKSSTVQVRGLATPVRTYVVLGAKPRTFRMSTRGVEGVETRLVGRDAEMVILKDHMRKVMSGGGSSLVTLLGDAGIGKSRLLLEFDDWIELQSERIFYFKGRARPDTRTVAFAPIRDMFAHRFGILETDSTADVLGKFRAEMADVLEPGEADVVGHMVGFDFSSSPAVQHLLGSPSFGTLGTAYLVTYFRFVAQMPTVMLVEDIQWADDRSLDVLEAIVDALRHLRLLIVCTTRPILFSRRPDWGCERDAGPGSRMSTVRLAPLLATDSRKLVREILQKANRVPNRLLDLVVDRADGNPYYLEELIKMLIEDDVIVRDVGDWRVEVDRLTRMRVPATLTGVLQARLDGLPSRERTVLQRAAVIGRQFWDSALVELSPNGSAGSIESDLADLCDRELVYAVPRSTFANTREYVFKHAMLRDVTYESVLRKHRRLYHGQVAIWLEAHSGERVSEYLDVIARHYELAGDTRRAADYLSRSGQERFEESGYLDAISKFEQALALLADQSGARRAELLVRLGQAYRLVGRYELAGTCLSEGLQLAMDAGDTASVVSARCGLGLVARLYGQYEVSERQFQDGLTMARAVGDDRAMAECLYNLGDLSYRRGRGAEAQRYAEESLAIHRHLGDHQGIAYALRVMGFANHMRGDYEAAAAFHEESRQHYIRIGDKWGIAACLINLGETARRRGDYERAARYYEESIAVSEETGAKYEIVVCNNNLGHTYLALGHLDRARWHLAVALRDSVAMGTQPITLEVLAGFAQLSVATGDATGAAELLGLLQSHPAFFDETRQASEPVLGEVRAVLTESELDECLAVGATLRLAEVVDRLLAESVASPPDAARP
jgi:class 3 adenylate cyclase/tetratricopeptide (TPR) repeat protein